MPNSLPLSDVVDRGLETPTSSMIPTTSETTALARELQQTAEHVRAVSAHDHAENTQHAYSVDWKGFRAWCADKKIPTEGVSPAVVVLYLGHLSQLGRSPPTIARVYCGISSHLREKYPADWPPGRRPELIERFLKGLKRTSAHQPAQKKPLTAGQLMFALDSVDLGAGLVGSRNRALLAIGFAGAFRRTELVHLEVQNVEVLPEGLRVTLPRSKTNQDGPAEHKGLTRAPNAAHCPAATLTAWLEAARAAGYPIDKGPLFRPIRSNGEVRPQALSERAVARLLKHVAGALGLDTRTFSGHSLRVGFVTSAALAGQTEAAIMRQTGHKRVEELRKYIRYATVFINNAGDGLLTRPK